MKTLLSKFTFLRPKFLEKIDRYLLVNYPRLWISRIHYVLFYGVIANIFLNLFVLVFLQPSQLYDFTRLLIWLIIIPELGVFIYWFYTQSLFNVEKEYGNTRHTIAILEILVYSVCTIVIFSSSLAMLATGIYKTANNLEIDKRPYCDGPFLLNFFSKDTLRSLQNNSGYDMNDIQMVLNTVENTLKTGETEEGNIFIDVEALIPDEKETTVLNEGDYTYISYFYENDTMRVVDGEAIIEVTQTEVSVKKKDGIHIVKNGKSLEVEKGDEIILNKTNASAFITVKEGKISIRKLMKISLRKGQAAIIEDGKDIFLIKGETTVEVDEGQNYLYNSYAYSTCVSLKRFLTDRKAYSLGIPIGTHYAGEDFLQYYYFIFWHLVFGFSGIFLLVVLKHSSWPEVAFTIIYLLVQIFPIVLGLYILATDPFGLMVTLGITPWLDLRTLGYSDSDFINIARISLIISAVFFAIYQTIRLANIRKTESYRRITFLRLVSLPIEACFILGFIALAFIIANDARYGQYELLITILPVFFLVYLPYSIIQKRLLIYLTSLPKG